MPSGKCLQFVRLNELSTHMYILLPVGTSHASRELEPPIYLHVYENNRTHWDPKEVLFWHCMTSHFHHYEELLESIENMECFPTVLHRACVQDEMCSICYVVETISECVLPADPFRFWWLWEYFISSYYHYHLENVIHLSIAWVWLWKTLCVLHVLRYSYSILIQMFSTMCNHNRTLRIV